MNKHIFHCIYGFHMVAEASDESGPIISESEKREELAVMYAG